VHKKKAFMASCEYTRYGGQSLHKLSHGESFLALVENRFSPDGLFILDEPEAAISPMRMLRLMADIHDLAKRGAQFIISTHSPILITLPDSDIIQLSDKGLEHLDYEPLTGKGHLVLSCTDGDAFLYYALETVESISGSGTITLHNDFMPVVPVIRATAETTLRWSVDGESFHKTISAGTWEIPELELRHGGNTVSVTSEGTTTFTYRPGRL